MASRSLGTLTLDLIAKVGGFTQGMDQAARTSQTRMKQIGKSVEDASGAVTKFTGVITALATGATAAWIKSNIDAAAEIQNLAQVAGTSTTEFQKLAYAAQTVGISNDKLGDIFKDVNDKVGDFLSTGGGELKDFFEKVAPLVGVTANQFRGLSGPQALGLYINTLEKAGVNQQQMTFFLESIADDASLLAPIMRNGGQAVKQLGDEAQRLGLILSEDTIKASKQFSNDMNVLGAVANSVGQQVAADLLPELLKLTETLRDPKTAEAAKALASGIVTAFNTVIEASKSMVEFVQWAAEEAAVAMNGIGLQDIDRLEKEADRLQSLMNKMEERGETGYGAYASIQDSFEKTRQQLEKAYSLQDMVRKNPAPQKTEPAAAAPANTNNKGITFANTAATKAQTDAGQKLLDTLREQNAVLQAQYDSIDAQTGKVVTLGQQAQELVKWEQELATLKGKKTLTAEQKSILASADLLTAQYKRNAALEKEVELRKKSVEEAAKLRAFTENLNSQLNTTRLDQAGSIATIGMGSKEAQRYQELISIRQQYQQQQDDLLSQRNSGDITQELYDKETQALSDALQQRLEMQQDYYSQLDQAQGNWVNGASEAWADYAANAQNVAAQMYDVFTNAIQGTEDALLTFVTTGKLSFKDLANSIIQDLARVALRQALVGAASSALGSIFGGGTGTMTGFSQGASYSLNAKGGVYDSPSLSAYSGGVYDSPQLFAFAKGAGVFGEAGPEAIMPLTRAADGSLGVRALNDLSANSAGSIQTNITINVTSDGAISSSETSSGADAMAKDLSQQMKVAAQDVINRNLRPGGSIWSAMNGRS